MLIEALIYGVLSAISGIGRTIENEQSKKRSASITPEGNVMSFGRTGQMYINDEEVYEWSEKDQNGIYHDLIIGVKSGKVYSDSYDRMMKKKREEAEESKQYAIKRGYLTYKKFCPQLNTEAETELKTGKVITRFGDFYNKKTGKTTYIKWYLQPSQIGRFEYNRTIKGDRGIKITKEEFDQLCRSCYQLKGLPNDYDILNELWGWDY